jgi:hypothetical protein
MRQSNERRPETAVEAASGRTSTGATVRGHSSFRAPLLASRLFRRQKPLLCGSFLAPKKTALNKAK